jgi:hypothetical protein
MSRSLLFLLVGLSLVASPATADQASIDSLRLLKGATGAAAARSAVQKTVAEGAVNLLPLLNAFQGATPLGANWLRSAFQSISAAESKAGRELPASEFTKFILDTKNSAAARRLAYESLLKQDATLEERFIPGLLQDAHPDFRRDAVARLLVQATEVEGELAVQLFRTALKGAVHKDQVTIIAGALGAAGDPVDLQKHFGFLPAWKIVGPFDNREMKGYAEAYPPESELDLAATYDGQLGEVSWADISTDDSYGAVDIAGQIENFKGSLMYSVTTFRSAEKQAAELRLGTPNAWKLWVNGELVFEREEYHRGTRMDQFRIPVSLQAGDNTIMLKVCQNEQEQDWAQDYTYQLRVCDSSGAAILPAGENNE